MTMTRKDFIALADSIRLTPDLSAEQTKAVAENIGCVCFAANDDFDWMKWNKACLADIETDTAKPPSLRSASESSFAMEIRVTYFTPKDEGYTHAYIHEYSDHCELVSIDSSKQDAATWSVHETASDAWKDLGSRLADTIE